MRRVPSVVSALLALTALLASLGCVQYELTVPSATAVARIQDTDGELKSTAAIPFPISFTFDGTQSAVDNVGTPASDFEWSWYDVPEECEWEVGSSDGFGDPDGETTSVTPQTPGAYMAQLNVAGESASESTNLSVATGFAVNVQGLEFRLTWDADTTDLDLHLINGAQLPGAYWTGNDCYFGNPTPDWGLAGEGLDNPAFLADVDTGYGPESIQVLQPSVGTYAIAVAYHNDWDTGATTTPEVSIWFDGQIIHSYPGQSREEGEVLFMGTLEWPGQTATDVGTVHDHTQLGGDPYNET